MTRPQELPRLGVVRVHIGYAKEYAIHGHSLARIEVRRISSIGGHSSPVGVVTGIDVGAAHWDHSGVVYVLPREEQEKVVAAVKELAGEVDG